MIATSNGSYANFIYRKIGWTQSGKAGFNKGDGQKFYALPYTQTDESIRQLKEIGNTGIPGEWMFQIDMERVARCQPGVKGDTCDRRKIFV